MVQQARDRVARVGKVGADGGCSQIAEVHQQEPRGHAYSGRVAVGVFDQLALVGLPLPVPSSLEEEKKEEKERRERKRGGGEGGREKKRKKPTKKNE
ncbi:hypothetical protein B1218_35045 [Pseudomonas ogarae]|nr:hypothetical protein B1218_35045 [Pseudomonas ogarae]